MIKNSKGITLVSLIITIVVMIIIASITVTTSMDRFEINNINKMKNDIEFLRDKVSNYYLKYNSIPVVKNNNNENIKYSYTLLDFEKNTDDNENYYIIDLEYMNDIALNYGREGFENINLSDDVYIINEKTHNIYYVKGIEWNGEYYHSNFENSSINDNIPPSTPKIKIISGTQNEEKIYTTNVELEIIPGKDNWSGATVETEYSIDDGENWKNIKELENNILKITQDGSYKVKVKTKDNKQNESETAEPLILKIEKKLLVKNIQGEIINEDENTEVYDEFNNKIVVPAGFMITTDADNVTQGVVVTDGTNEFVWVPVGEEIKNETKTAKIELGRYANFSLNNANGQYVPVESSDTVIANYYKEEQVSTKGNTVAIDLKNGFLKSVSQYGGYYIGRYEARVDSNKLVSNKNSNVWNYISQTDAADKCRNMYLNNSFKSDLINSYAWDTAIIFIQTFGENKGNYANETSYNKGKLSEKGTDNDKACNIFDMASNCREWTTETCDNKNIADFCHTYRGGYFNVAASLASSRVGNKNETAYNMSFRPILYIEPQN